ncbi:MAG TPA: hypothetical protein P5165_04025 [Spirochaetia bacterium]|nr:hypothetical protein [Spirochaetia bacterium]
MSERTRPGPRIDEELWTAALLSSDTEALIAAARNYLGPVRTPYDKRELVSRLAAFLRRPDSREGAVALLDLLDARIVGSLLVAGPLSEPELRSLFVGELPLFDLGIRVSNLLDRLLLFRFETGGRRYLAVNPILAEELGRAVLDPVLLFGAAAEGAQGPGAGEGLAAEAAPATGAAAHPAEGVAAPSAGASTDGDVAASGTAATRSAAAQAKGLEPKDGLLDAEAATAFFLFLHHAPGSLRKGGGLTKRASERLAALFPGLAGGGAGGAAAAEAAVGGESRFDAMARALAAAGALGGGEEGRGPDPAAYAALAAEWGAALPAFLATALARSGAEEAAMAEGRASLEAEASLVAAALAAAPPGLGFSKGGLSRWLGLASRRAAQTAVPRPRSAAAQAEPPLIEGAEAERLLAALLALGLAAERDGGIRLRAPWRDSGRSEGGAGEARERGAAESLAAEGNSAEGNAAEAGKPVLVAEGSHALHLLPEASLEDRLFVGRLARPTAFGKVWSLELDRDSARRGFAAGLGAKESLARLEALAGRPLPQSLSFSLASWEEEYRALRLYRGFVLVADERLRQIVERSERLKPLLAERLAPGVYVLAAASPEEAAAALREAGLEPPPEVRRATPEGWAESEPAARGAGALRGPGARGSALALRIESAVAPLAGLAAEAAPGAAGGAAASGGAGGPEAGAGERDAGRGGAPKPRLDPAARVASLKAALAALAAGGAAERAEAARAAAGPGGAEGAARGRAPAPDRGAADRGSLASGAHGPERGPEVLRELEDRIERRLVLSERQLAQADARPERIEAAGLDYMGKVRIVERALRTSGDRLEVLYRLPGADPARALLRPVRLDKTDKGLVLEAEDLATGGPVRVPLGAMSSVKRMRASLFGEEA